MSLLDNLPHTATATRRRRTMDAMLGEKDTTPTTLFTDRACWQQPLSTNEIKQSEKRGENVTHKVYFATDPGLDEQCMLTIGGSQYSVRSVSDPDASAGLGWLWRVTVQWES